jgi:hypothetical protein
MKNLLLILAITISSFSFAQGNLQFNQIINLQGGESYLVPAGKCLKIESLTLNEATFTTNLTNVGGCNACYYDSEIYMQIGSMTFSAKPPDQISGCPTPCPATNSRSLTTPDIKFPLWIKEGSNINLNGSNLNSNGIFLTGIEFNIIP